jgi:hypothetical protein
VRKGRPFDAPAPIQVPHNKGWIGSKSIASGVVSRTLSPLHIIAVASSSYMKGRTRPDDPSGLAALDGIVMRSSHTGRIRERMMRDIAGAEKVAPLKESVVFDDPEAMCRAALLGLGVTLIAVPHALPYLESGALGAAIVFRRGSNLDLLRNAHAVARQNACLRRFRGGCFPVATPRWKIYQQHRLAPTRVRLLAGCGRALCALVVSAAPASSDVPMNLRRVSMMVLLDGAALWQRFVVGILQPKHGKTQSRLAALTAATCFIIAYARLRAAPAPR